MGWNAAMLQPFMPQRALEVGTPGHASVRVTVSELGEISVGAVVSELPRGYGFGEACRSFLRSHAAGWQPAIDDQGRPVAHAMRFACGFEPPP